MSDKRFPLVSIVTPSYNQGRYLEEAIRSVLAQGYPNIEYIVIDGGSTDGSVEIIRKYADRLAYWLSEPDQGQSDAINKGWAVATGEIFTYLNSDDFYLPGAISAAVHHLRRDLGIGVVYGSYTVVDEKGEVLTPQVTPAEWSPEGFVDGLPAPSMFFRREVLARAGFMDVTLRFAMDSDLCIRVALEGFCFSRVPGAPLVGVREWNGAKSFDWSQAGLTEVWLTLDRLAASPKAPASVRARIPAIKAQACLWPAYQYSQFGDMKRARYFLLKSLRTHWPIGLSPEFLRLLAGTLLDGRGQRLLGALRKVLGAQGRR